MREQFGAIRDTGKKTMKKEMSYFLWQPSAASVLGNKCLQEATQDVDSHREFGIENVLKY